MSGQRLSVTLGVEEGLMLRLRRAQDQVSRSLGKSASLEETLSQLVDFYLQRKDPVERAKRVIAKKGMQLTKKTTQAEPATASSSQVTAQSPSEAVKTLVTGRVQGNSPASSRTPIPAAIEHAVRLRDRDQCQHPQAAGDHCGEHRWVDLHHILPLSQGGGHTIDNLVTLCRTHHQQIHRDATR